MARQLGVTINREIMDGKSAFHVHHRAEGGALHAFERDVRSGLHHGGLLIVSRLDRLSREGSDEGSDLLRTLSRGGVDLATADDRELYEAGKPRSLDQAIRAMLKWELAREESAKKQERGRMNYDIKHQRCRANKLAVTRNVAPWIVVRPDRTIELLPVSWTPR